MSAACAPQAPTAAPTQQLLGCSESEAARGPTQLTLRAVASMGRSARWAQVARPTSRPWRAPRGTIAKPSVRKPIDAAARSTQMSKLPGTSCDTGPAAATAAVPCPAGTIAAAAGRGSVRDCIATPAGSYSVAGAANATGLCAPGFYCPLGSTTPRATACPASSRAQTLGWVASKGATRRVAGSVSWTSCTHAGSDVSAALWGDQCHGLLGLCLRRLLRSRCLGTGSLSSRPLLRCGLAGATAVPRWDVREHFGAAAS